MSIENKIRQAWNNNKLFFILALFFIVYGIYTYNQPVPTQTQSIFGMFSGLGIFGVIAILIGLVILGVILFGGLPGMAGAALVGLVILLFTWGGIALLINYWYIGIIVLVIYILIKR